MTKEVVVLTFCQVDTPVEDPVSMTMENLWRSVCVLLVWQQVCVCVLLSHLIFFYVLFTARFLFSFDVQDARSVEYRKIFQNVSTRT